MRIGIDVTMLQVRQGRHGIGSYLGGLIGALARTPEHDYSLLAWRAPALDLPPLPSRFRVVRLPAPPFGRGRALFSHQLALPVLARRLRLDMLHLPGVAVAASLPAAPLWPSVPVIVTVHDVIPLLFPDTVLPHRRHRIFYRLMLGACERAAHVLCDSEATRRDLIAHLGLPAARLSVAPLAAAPSFTPEPVAPSSSRARGLPDGFVLHVGGPAPTKNLRGLLAAMAALWDGGRLGTHLVSVTSVPFDPAALYPAVAPHRARLHVLDGVSSAFLLWLYQRALVLVVPSLYEGFGLPVLEAMGAGCPVIAARVASLPEVGGEAAVYVEPGSVAALADAIAALLGDPPRRAQARAAGLRHAATFTWERTAAATLAAYEAVGETPVKIGIDASLASRRGSGTGRYAALLVERLLALDQENDYVLYFRSGDREANPLFPVRGPRITTRVTDAPLTLMRIHMNLPLWLARDGVDIYHSLGFFLPWLWRGRMVVSIHDIHPVIQRELWGWPGTRAADLVLRAHIPIALRQACRILALSEYVKQTLCDRYRLEPSTIVVAPPGIDPLFLLPPSPGEIEAAERRLGAGRFLLYVGALAPHKNVAGLVRAFAGLTPRRGAEPVRLVLTGQPVGRYLELTLAPLIRELGVGDRIVLTGYVGDEMLRALYHRAAALVLPSFGEGFGLPVLEAMACGAPVVTSRGTALPETAGDAALYVDPHRPDDIAAAMGRLLEDDTLRQDLIARGDKRAATFTWDRTAVQVLRAYREAAAAER